MLIRVLAVAGSRQEIQEIARSLARSEVLITAAEDERQMWRRLGSETFDMVVLSLSAIEQPSPSIVEQIRELPDRPDVVVLGEPRDSEERASFLSAGCLALLDTGMSGRVFGQALRSLIERRREERPTQLELAPAVEPLRLASFTSNSPAMQRFLAIAHRTVQTDSTLLIRGETGVGKEWLARAIHGESLRSNDPFIAVNCAALSESLLESELFGHQKGAFTGASQSRRGHFELAHGGTIFLDEIAELPPHLQAKLLRVLEERSIQALGSERSIEVDVRVMAATNRDLEEAIRERQFRLDLYYRLNVVSLTVPPLRERREDIPTLAEYFIENLRHRVPHEIVGIHPGAMDALSEHTWPGNVRELFNALERAVMLCQGDVIGVEDLPLRLSQRAGDLSPGANLEQSAWHDLPWPAARRSLLEEAERTYFTRLLREEGGRVGEVAARAGIDPRSLYDKMRRLGLRKEDFRVAARRCSRSSRQPGGASQIGG
jgi:DNA-binding NtrC family response regulator